MKDYRSLSHTKWDCKYHVVFIPKYRRKRIFGKLRGHLGEILHELAKQKQSRIVEGHLRPDHVYMCISIPPKFSVSSVVGFIKGKSAISIARNFLGRRRNFTGESFWARGLCLLFIHPRASPLIFLGRGGHYAFMLRLLLGSLVSAFKTRQRAARFQRPGERGKERTNHAATLTPACEKDQ